MNNGGSTNTTLITFVVVIFVVVRFLAQEMRERIVRLPALWIRPAFLVAVTAALLIVGVSIPGARPGEVLLGAIVGALAGILTGVLVVRSTTFAPADRPGAVRVRGSMRTVTVWVAAIALRFLARFLFAHADDATQFALNAGLVALVTAAFIVVALAFQRAIRSTAPILPAPIGGS